MITNGQQNIFLRHLAAGSTELVSIGTNDLAGIGSSSSPTISSNGQFVAFSSYAYNMASANYAYNQAPFSTNIYLDNIYVRDVLNGTNRLVSVNVTGTKSADSDSQNPQLTPDGRFVVFGSKAADLTTNRIGCTCYFNIFVADLMSNTMTLASVDTNGNAAADDTASEELITPDGRYVTFESADP